MSGQVGFRRVIFIVSFILLLALITRRRLSSSEREREREREGDREIVIEAEDGFKSLMKQTFYATNLICDQLYSAQILL